MRLLLQAALRSRKHLSLLIVTFATLLCLTVASQMEMFALGVLSNNGSDFFTLFSTGQAIDAPKDSISLQTVEAKWHLIDKDGTGAITKQQASAYMAANETNPLNWLIKEFRERFKFTNNIKALVEALNYFYQKTGSEITFEYILFKDFNDSARDADDLVKVYRQVPADEEQNEVLRSPRGSWSRY